MPTPLAMYQFGPGVATNESGQSQNIAATLQRILKAPVQLTITDNVHVFLNAAFRKKNWHVRLHWMFLRAKPSLWRHIALYVSGHHRASSRRIDQYIEDHWHWVRHPLPPIRTKGRVHDLKKMFDRLNRRFFKNRVTAHITWGKSLSRRAYEQIQLGSYSTSRNLITVHPNLDQKFVPRQVVEACVFHEMCHAVLPVKKVGSRKQIHPPAFKRLEARYPHLEKARAWEEKNIGRLLKRRVGDRRVAC